MPALIYSTPVRYEPWDTYTTGKWKPLGGAKILYSGNWITLKSTDRIYGNSSWYYIGMVIGARSNPPYYTITHSYLVSSGGTQTDIKVTPGGDLIIISGGTASNVIENGGYVDSRSGAVVTFVSNTISGGYIGQGIGTTIHSGTTVISTTIVGKVDVYSGGIISSAQPTNTGSLFVSDGGVAKQINLRYYGGRIYIQSGGSADIIKASNPTFIFVQGQANSVYINSSGYLYISSGGSVNNITVNRSGTAAVLSGGTATITWNPWQGVINSSSGATISYLQRDAQVYYGGGTYANQVGLISKGTSLSDLYVSPWYSTLVYSGGIVDNIVIASSAYTSVYSGGVISNVTINAGGSLYVQSGGEALDIAWTPFSGGKISAYDAVITYAGDPKGVYYGYPGSLYSSALSMSNILVGVYNSMYVMNSGLVDTITVKDYGCLYIHSGGVASNTSLISGGNMSIYQGGEANSIQVNKSGRLIVFDSASAVNIVENGGYVDIHESASAAFIPNTFSGSLEESATVHSGNTATSVTLWRGGELSVLSSGIANYTSIRGNGSLFIYDKGIANGTRIDGGWLVVSSGGKANNQTFVSGGIHIYPGGSMDSAEVNTSCALQVESGGIATNIIENGGYVDIHESASAAFMPHTFYGITVPYLQLATIHSGTTGSNITVASQGELIISSGGIANRITINSRGYTLIKQSGVAYNVTVNQDGSMRISSGGTAISVTADPHAIIYVDSGGSIYYTSN